MLSLILGFVTGLTGPILNFAGRLADLQIAKVNAASDTEKAKINAEIEEVHDKRAVLIAEAGNRLGCFLNASMRFLLAIGPLVVLTKLMVWDKVIGSINGCYGDAGREFVCQVYNTDPLDAYQWGIIAVVTGFYFVTSSRR